MSIDIIPLTTCEFCGQGAGAIMIDVPALANMRKTCEEGDWEEMIDHTEVLKFNSAQPGDGPCPHLVYLLVDFWWGAEIDPMDWSTGVQWTNPKIDQYENERNLRHSFPIDNAHEELSPEHRYRLEKFGDNWPDLDPANQERRFYQTNGMAIFAKDIHGFLSGLNVEISI